VGFDLLDLALFAAGAAFRAVESRPAPQTSPPPGTLQTFIDDEMLRWGKVVRAAGIAGTE
jgi:hypothetical protein